MSKKKNTLQDLDNFLKQQAATLVTPETLTKPVEDIADVHVKAVEPPAPVQAPEKKVVDEFPKAFPGSDPAFRKKLYDFIIESLQNQKESLPEDKMLINTALYLKSGSDWKNVIRQYWRER
jgi:hypothetical protein